MAILSRFVVTVSRTATVLDAIQAMTGAKVGSVAIVDGNVLVGIFSERDVMLRVVAEGRDPKTTAVEEVMTSPVQTIQKRTTGEEALRIMVQNHIRHLPVVDEMGAGPGNGFHAQPSRRSRSTISTSSWILSGPISPPTASAAKRSSLRGNVLARLLCGRRITYSDTSGEGFSFPRNQLSLLLRRIFRKQFLYVFRADVSHLCRSLLVINVLPVPDNSIRYRSEVD